MFGRVKPSKFPPICSSHSNIGNSQHQLLSQRVVTQTIHRMVWSIGFKWAINLFYQPEPVRLIPYMGFPPLWLKIGSASQPFFTYKRTTGPAGNSVQDRTVLACIKTPKGRPGIVSVSGNRVVGSQDMLNRTECMVCIRKPVRLG